jgi:metal-sulfur cluster biosynthetic enzyme
MVSKEEIMAAVATVEDPEIGLGVVDLGLIYDVVIAEDSAVSIRMTLTTPYCPYGPQLVSEVQKAAEDLPGVLRADVEVVWDPLWDPNSMASDYAKDVLGIW